MEKTHSPTGYWAAFKRPDDALYEYLAIEKFTDAGEALVYAPEINAKRLVPASSLDNFTGLSKEAGNGNSRGLKIIGAIPAQPGWTITTSDGLVGGVEAWGVLENGDLVPIDDVIQDVTHQKHSPVLAMNWLDAPDYSYTLHRRRPGDEHADE
jgi:hypothetical protein